MHSGTSRKPIVVGVAFVITGLILCAALLDEAPRDSQGVSDEAYPQGHPQSVSIARSADTPQRTDPAAKLPQFTLTVIGRPEGKAIEGAAVVVRKKDSDVADVSGRTNSDGRWAASVELCRNRILEVWAHDYFPDRKSVV